MSLFLVGLSGAQGGGKTTLLNGLEPKGWSLDTFRVSRAVQEQLGWKTLDNVMQSPETMMMFQEEVFKQKYEHDYGVKQFGSQVCVLTERTFADICAYTTHWTWELHYQQKWTLSAAMQFLKPYTDKCIKAQAEIYDGVLLLPYMKGQMKWEADPNRAKFDTVEQIYEGVERFVQRPEYLRQKKLTITAHSVEDRIEQVDAFLKDLVKRP